MSAKSKDVFSEIDDKLDAIKELYDNGSSPLNELYELSKFCAKYLADNCTVRRQGVLQSASGAQKNYDVFLAKTSKGISRPVRIDLYIKNPTTFYAKWEEFCSLIDEENCQVDFEYTNAVIYTAISSVACVFDVYKPSSRKTPGTFFEILIGSILSRVSGLKRAKQITLPDSKYKVPTDIVLISESGPSLVIPTKITTRERIVQVWSQQRILENAFPSGTYKSALVSVSELQRDGEDGVAEICVPGQVGLFQKYLANVTGVYYLDLPKAYKSVELGESIKVGDFGDLLRNDLREILEF